MGLIPHTQSLIKSPAGFTACQYCFCYEALTKEKNINKNEKRTTVAAFMLSVAFG